MSALNLRSRLRAAWTLGQGVALGLPDASADSDPFELFSTWFRAANEAGIGLAESFTLATCTPQGVPSARVVLLKQHGPEGFVFYTNYGSRKAQEIEANPRVAMTFHWGIHARQVRVEGRAERTSAAQSEAYFHTRARGSQIGAWASRQSEVLSDRSLLAERFQRAEVEFSGREVPLPEFWGGYLVVPHRVEFWQGRASRLHDRLIFSRDEPGEPWRTERLFP